MIKTCRASLSVLLLTGFLIDCHTRAAAEEYPDIAPHLQFSLGWSIVEDSDGPRPSYASPLNLSRPGTKNAIKYWDIDGSPYIEGHVEVFPFPQRFYTEVEYNGDDDWFGELRHAYKDLFTFRDISRRVYHNLNSLTLYDFGAAAVSRQDTGTEYGLSTDMHQFRLRLKTPDFPAHLYGTGEIVLKRGSRQQRFLGGSGYFTDPTRVVASRNIDSISREFSLGANSHLRWFEVDYAHTWQDFSADDANSSLYAYSVNDMPPDTRGAGSFPHNRIPEIEGRKDVLKLHSNHTGQIFVSATFADVARTNNSSGAEADRFVSFGEVLWTPMTTLSLGMKMRRQDDETEAPVSVETGYRDAFTGILWPAVTVYPGVEAITDTFTGFFRYSPMARVSLKGQYTKQIRDVAEQSAVAWHEPSETDSDAVELGAAWRALPSFKVNVKYLQKDTSLEAGAAQFINYKPEKERMYKADATWSPTPMTTVYLSGNWREARADNFQVLTGSGMVVTDGDGNRANRFDSVSRQYLSSVTHVLNNRLSITASYAYLVLAVERDLGLDSFPDPDLVDTGYSHKLDSHHASLTGVLRATDMLNLQAAVDYTTGRGDYMLTSGLALEVLPIGLLSRTETQECGVRFEGEYDFGGGWKGGMVLRYIDFIDSSFDNPADGEALGALVKITRVFQ